VPLTAAVAVSHGTAAAAHSRNMAACLLPTTLQLAPYLRDGTMTCSACVQGPARAAAPHLRSHDVSALAQRALRVAASAPGPGASGQAAGSAAAPLPPCPKTAHDFMQALRMLRMDASQAGGISAVVPYVQSIPPGSFRDVFKSNLDGKILREFVEVLSFVTDGAHARDESDDDMWCVACLKGLVAVERFAVVYAMLPSAVRAQFAALKSKLVLTDADALVLAKIK
jgi:hypothetical protein